MRDVGDVFHFYEQHTVLLIPNDVKFWWNTTKQGKNLRQQSCEIEFRGILI